MKTVEEQNLRFQFDNEWYIVEKWDNCLAYQRGSGKLNGTLTANTVGCTARR